MHELGIIVHVARALEEIAKENELTEISSVTLEVGEVSGIVPDFLYDAWEYYRKKVPIMENSHMKFETLPAVTYCEDCRGTYPTVQYGKQCPHCGSVHTYLLKGNECNIKEIEAC